MISAIKPVITGFIISLICTLGAYFAAVLRFPGFLWMIALLWFVQTAAQFVCFFSLGKEAKPYWNLQMFLFMVSIVLIVVGLSIWIMYNLNYMMMPK
ncbi:MAG TPA: hypothetical protein VLE96_00635 [Chlamydiales bacterium]|nr:hypothetical protein [Chlamydiales bacterium]